MRNGTKPKRGVTSENVSFRHHESGVCSYQSEKSVCDCETAIKVENWFHTDFKVSILVDKEGLHSNPIVLS